MPRLVIALIAWLSFSATLFSASTDRFTQQIKPEERTPAGLQRLNSDQLAVLDALVRRDIAARGVANADAEAPTKFSERLTEKERELTGIAQLAAEERARLDALVERHSAAKLARTLLAPTTYAPRRSSVESVEKDERRKIHGSFSLSYGWGKGGYSEKSGSMVLNYDDPEGRYSITVGYRETQVEGGPGYGVYVDGPPYRR